MFKVSRSVSAAFDGLVVFFQPSHAQLVQERRREELTREDVGDGAPPFRVGDKMVRIRRRR